MTEARQRQIQALFTWLLRRARRRVESLEKPNKNVCDWYNHDGGPSVVGVQSMGAA